jgi:hypothetical protein
MRVSFRRIAKSDGTSAIGARARRSLLTDERTERTQYFLP